MPFYLELEGGGGGGGSQTPWLSNINGNQHSLTNAKSGIFVYDDGFNTTTATLNDPTIGAGRFDFLKDDLSQQFTAILGANGYAGQFSDASGNYGYLCNGTYFLNAVGNVLLNGIFTFSDGSKTSWIKEQTDIYGNSALGLSGYSDFILLNGYLVDTSYNAAMKIDHRTLIDRYGLNDNQPVMDWTKLRNTQATVSFDDADHVYFKGGINVSHSGFGDKNSITTDGPISTKSLYASAVNKVFSDSPYSIGANDFTVTYDATGGNSVVNLPAATGSGRLLHVKKTDSSVNTVTITRAGSDLIDGAATKVILTQYSSYYLQDTASAVWSVI